MPSESKLTPELHTLIVEATALGMPRGFVAKAAGVGVRTLRRWLSLGKRGRKDSPYVALLAGVKEAEAEGVRRNLEVIRKAAQGHEEVVTKVEKLANGTELTTTTTRNVYCWTAAAWLLERMHPEHYGRFTAEMNEVRKCLRDFKKAKGRNPEKFR